MTKNSHIDLQCSMFTELFEKTEAIEDVEKYVVIARLLGKRMVKAGSRWWEEARQCAYSPAPAGLPIGAEPGDVRDIFLSGRAIVVQVLSNRPDVGALTYGHGCADRNYELSSVSPGARRKVQRGLEYCQVKELAKVDYAILRAEGLDINKSALTRQKRSGLRAFRDRRLWEDLVKAYACHPRVRVYGAFFTGKLCAYLAAIQIGRIMLYLHSFSLTECLRYYPNNALLFYATKAIMKTTDVDMLYLGLESLSPKPSLNEFMLKMGFQRYPIRQEFILHSVLQPLVGKWTRAFVSVTAKHLGYDYLLTVDNLLRQSTPYADVIARDRCRA